MTRFAGGPNGSPNGSLAACGTQGPWCVEDLSTSDLDWDGYAGAPLLEQWAQELTAAVAAPPEFADELWTVAGTRTVLVGDDRAWNGMMLRMVAAYAGVRFAEVCAGDVPALAELPALVPPCEHAPLLLHLQGGDWLRTPEPNDQSAEARTMLHDRIAELLASFTPEAPVVVVVSVGELTDLPARLRAATFDRAIRLVPLSLRDRGELFLHGVGMEHCAPALQQAATKVGIIARNYFEEEQLAELASAALRRRAVPEQRPVVLRDLLELAANGVGERVLHNDATPEQRHQITVHEAGHAVAAICDSNGTHVPECVSVCDTEVHGGVAINDLELNEAASNLHTLPWVRHRIRIMLGGRAAEEVVLGGAKVSTGASNDLYRATKMVMQGITQEGLSPDMDTPAKAAGALLVTQNWENDEWIFPTAMGRVEEMTRRFLTREYEQVRALLAANRPLLDAVVVRLEQEQLLLQEQLKEIATAHGVGGGNGTQEARLQPEPGTARLRTAA